MDRRTWIILAICLVVLALIGVGALLGNDDHGGPSGGGGSDEVNVLYEITGTTNEVDVTLATPGGGTEQHDNARVPWRESFTFHRGERVYVSAQNQLDAQSVTCTIYVNQREAQTNSSIGAYVIATCSGRL